MLDVKEYHCFFDEDESPIDDCDLTDDEVEFLFDCWFSNLLTETKQNCNGVYYTEPNTLEDVAECISDSDLEYMCYCAGWDSEVVFKSDIRNAVYWFALHLLYRYNHNVIEEGKCSCGCDGKLFDYDGVWIFLDSITPIKK